MERQKTLIKLIKTLIVTGIALLFLLPLLWMRPLMH